MVLIIQDTTICKKLSREKMKVLTKSPDFRCIIGTVLCVEQWTVQLHIKRTETMATTPVRPIPVCRSVIGASAPTMGACMVWKVLHPW